MRHRVTPAEDGSGALAAHDEQYRARFDAEGFGFTLGEQPSGLGVSLRGVQRGGTDVALVPGRLERGGQRGGARPGLGDDRAGDGARRRARVGRGAGPPAPGTGDLRLEAELRGLDGVATRVADGSAWRFPLGDGRAARMGELVVKDATGAELHRALPQVRGDAAAPRRSRPRCWRARATR